MAHHRRKRSALNTAGHRFYKWAVRTEREARYGANAWMRSWPASWDILFHRRPVRRHAKAAAHAVVRGADPDEVLWPLSKRPHRYFW